MTGRGGRGGQGGGSAFHLPALRSPEWALLAQMPKPPPQRAKGWAGP